MTSVMTYSCMKKVSLFFSPLFCRIQDKIRSDPDPGYKEMVGSGSGINILNLQHFLLCDKISKHHRNLVRLSLQIFFYKISPCPPLAVPSYGPFNSLAQYDPSPSKISNETKRNETLLEIKWFLK
jgi:hypothetical protein